MNKYERTLWGVGLMIQFLLVIGALLLAWKFESGTLKQLESAPASIVEQMLVAENVCVSNACKQGLLSLKQSNHSLVEALHFSINAIVDLALAMLFLGLIQLLIYLRLLKQKPPPSADMNKC